MENFTTDNNGLSYQKKIWIKGGIYALIVILLLFLNATFNVLLLILAGTLIAIFFRGLSDLICRKTKWKDGVCLTISIVGALLLLIGIFWMIGAKVQGQVNELSETLPKTVDNAKAWLNKSPLGEKIVEKISSDKSMNKAEGFAGTFFRSTFGVFGDVYVVLFISIFLTVSPRIYKNGIVQLIPKNGEAKGEEVLNKLGENLKKWLKGQLFSMLVVFVFTAIGLAILGMPLWLVLALMAGLLSFIPNFGPLLAIIPAVLIALLDGPEKALMVAGLYILVQLVESNFITPMIQQKLVNTPPALIIIAQLLISPFAGGWGLVMATPILVIIMVLVQELYIKPKNKSQG